MTDDKQDLPPNSNVRRKLLRGSFAAPVVLTVHSGSAQAASSVGACLVRANSSPLASGIGVTSADDSLFRYRLWALVNNSNPNSIVSYWIRGNELSAFVKASQMPFLSSNQFQRFDVATNTLVDNTITMSTPSMASHTFKQVNQWVVLRINASGKVVGAGSGVGGTAVSDSCWNSFAVASL